MQKDCINDFRLCLFFPVLKAKGKFSAAQPEDPPISFQLPQQSHCPLPLNPSFPYKASLTLPLGFDITSLKKFCFMQLSSGKYTPPLHNRSLSINLLCSLCILILYLLKLPTGSPDVYHKPLAPTHQVSTFSFSSGLLADHSATFKLGSTAGGIASPIS